MSEVLNRMFVYLSGPSPLVGFWIEIEIECLCTSAEVAEFLNMILNRLFRSTSVYIYRRVFFLSLGTPILAFGRLPALIFVYLD